MSVPYNLDYETHVSSMTTCSNDSKTLVVLKIARIPAFLRFLRPRARHNDIFRPCTHINRNEVRDQLDPSKISRSSTNEPSERPPE